MTASDNSLIAEACAGNRAAFEQLLERHYDMMFRVAYRFTGHRQDAEDIAQDVCIGLAHKLALFKGKSSFSSWLYRVVVNACMDAHKHRASTKRSEDGFVELEAHTQAEAAEASQQLAWLYRAIHALEPDLKATALLVLSEEMSHAQAAEVLGCKESTISWRMHEIRKKLQASLKGAL